MPSQPIACPSYPTTSILPTQPSHHQKYTWCFPQHHPHCGHPVSPLSPITHLLQSAGDEHQGGVVPDGSHCCKQFLTTIQNLVGSAFVLNERGARPGVPWPHQDLHTSLPVQHSPINVSYLTLCLWQPFTWFSLQFSSLFCCLSGASSAYTNAPSQETLRTPMLASEIFMEQEPLVREAAWGNLACDDSVMMTPSTSGEEASFPLLLPQLVPEDDGKNHLQQELFGKTIS